MPNGTLTKQTDRVFVDLRGDEPGIPDGMKVDSEGNVYCGGAATTWRLAAPTGKPCISPAGSHLGAVNVRIPGIPVPTAKK